MDIIDCTEGREQDLKDLLVTFLNKTGDCAVNRINEVLDSFATVVVDIRNINEEIKTITVKLDECGTDANPTACVIEVFIK